jgi:hypothetical protein
MSEADEGAGADSERRSHDRVPVELNVRLASGDHRFELISENVSLGGIFLQTATRMPDVNETVELEIVLPKANHGRDKKLPVRATVLYSVQGKGCGLEFSWWDDDEQKVRDELEEWLLANDMRGDETSDALGAGALTTASQIDGEPVEDE